MGSWTLCSRVFVFAVFWMPALAASSIAQQAPSLNYAPSSIEVAGRPPELFSHLRDNLFVALDPLDSRLVIVDASGRVVGSSLPLSFVPDTLREIPEAIVFSSMNSAREVVLRRSIDLAAIGQLAEAPLGPVPAAAISLRRAGPRAFMIKRAAANGGDISVRSIGPRYLADVELLAEDSLGRRYVQSSEIAKTSPALDIKVFVQRFSRDGRLLDIADVPIAQMDAVPRRFIAVNSDGEVTALIPTEAGLFLQKLDFRPPNAAVPAARPNRVPVGATVIPSDRREAGDEPVPAPRSATPTTKRDAIMQRANAYMAINWTLRKENFLHDGIENHCAKTERRYWRRPTKLTERLVDSTFGPMPYNWGGADTPETFTDKLKRGFLAGNVCTCREAIYNQCQVSVAAGVDCSGFVSRAWGVAKHGTSNLRAIADPISDLRQLKPGDALNKAGSHVRLFVRTVPGPQLLIEVLESATNLRCEGVCRSTYTVAELSGYQPLRYRGARN